MTASSLALMAQDDPKTIPKTVLRRPKAWRGWCFGDTGEAQPCIISYTTSRVNSQHHVISFMSIVTKTVTIIVIIRVIVVVDVVAVAFWFQAPKERGLPKLSLRTTA